MPFFCEPVNIIPQWCWDMIEHYYLVKKYSVPLASDLNSIDVWTADSFLIIENELNNIKTHKEKLNGT